MRCSGIPQADRAVLFRVLSAGLLLALLTTGAQAQGAPQCHAPAAFPNTELLADMRRGVNLPGWDHEDVSRRPALAQLRAVRDAGLTHIRLLVNDEPFRNGGADTYLDALYEQVILLLSLDFSVSIDLHAGGEIGREFAGNVAGASDLVSGIWQQLARVARRLPPERVAVELLNEPEFGQDDWMGMAERLVRELRQVLPDHTIVLGPSGPQRHEMLSGMEPLADRNIVYAVHYYDPFAFTHQGANWGAADDPLRLYENLPFPAPAGDPAVAANIEKLRSIGAKDAAAALQRSIAGGWDVALLTKAYDTMEDWALRHDRPVIVNEFGVLNFVAPRQSRLGWLALNTHLAEARCIGWTHWDFQDGFGLTDPETGLPDPAIIDALMPDR